MNRLISDRSTLSGQPREVDVRAENSSRSRGAVPACVFGAHALAIAVAGCTPHGMPPGRQTTRVPAQDTPGASVEFAEVSASPETMQAPTDVPPCGEFDGALTRAARRVVANFEKTGTPPETPELEFLLRQAGSPHPWPHAWTLSAPRLADADVPARLARFLGAFHEGGIRRCGVATSRAKDGTESIAVVVVDALADLDRLPTAAHVGTWLSVSATMLVPASAAKLVVLGPSGEPRTVPTTLHGSHASATFAPDRPGRFVVQLLATTSDGPRPVLDATVFADVPPSRPDDAPAPGESDAPRDDDADSLARMVNGARTAESLEALAHRPDLDAIARAHAERLVALGRLAHDAGDGTPLTRMRAAGLDPNRSGENVAHATSAALAHRRLWASPSHRQNLLDPSFDSLGVGTAKGADGSLWICELFARFR